MLRTVDRRRRRDGWLGALVGATTALSVTLVVGAAAALVSRFGSAGA